MTALPFRSIPDMFLKRVAQTPDARAFAAPAPGDAGAPVWLTWKQTADRATAIAAGLHGLGVRNEDRVAILSNTRLEWILADLGVMLAGAATTTVYPTTEPEDAQYIVRDSGSKVLIAENPEQAAKLAGLDLPVVVIDGEPAAGQLTLAQLEERGHAALAEQPALVTELVETIKPEHLATLIYTSGTTGRPKGVELLHAGWVWEGWAQSDLGIMNSDDLQYLWLPLSHSFGKTLVCGVIYVGMPTYVDGRIDKLVENLAKVQPTLMCSAPRVFEKVYNRVIGNAQETGKLKILLWAVGIGKQVVALKHAGKQPGFLLSLQHKVADRLVFTKIRARLGGRMRAMVSGSAPLAVEIGEFFHAVGLNVLEGYGLTETSAGSFINRENAPRIGTVGTPLGDLECKIDTDGEVLLRGTPVMRGYHNLPKETAEAFTEDGWFRTGDIGELDSDGYLRITDRKKDLIKTSGGKYVAPSHIEGMFKSVCPLTSQAVVIGQARNFCTMLITLDPDALAQWASGGPLEGKSYPELVAAPEVHAVVDGYVQELNGRLNRWETVKKFRILPRDLSIEDGELTPSLKVKRKAVETAFAGEIDKMYAGSVANV
ncbi:AMP-dependent synthetase [Virgisporangium aliadipatigenens]|uniref:AMP-dependent synthetase n=1 Tax=Virgisporangium aliadipatigenens TaxID=741659 RepID=A0A8J4DVN8_9ACTN|nr:long-chain fatty acid--CoA ligase [Virgisporangium aliadipatigenens]GIJ52014.1 AMP-dependent synthetase [Virgisporangium aliadipatigenens]